MKTDRIVGRTARFTFDDGPMAGETFEHAFDANGTVTFRRLGGDAKPATTNGNTADSKPSPGVKYEVESIRDDVFAVSYRSSSGYTLTAVLDFKTNKLVAFASNEKMHMMQRGTFEVASPAASADSSKRDPHREHAAQR